MNAPSRSGAGQGQVRLAREGALAVVTLSHPGRLNAMSRSMWIELRRVFQTMGADDTVRCVIVRGEGGAFCAGGDISEYPSFRFDPKSLREFHESEVWAALAAMLACDLPMIAQIEGPCMGARLEIASCCDIRLAGSSSKFGAPIAKLGFPMAPREAALVRGAIGDALARDMLLAASVHDAVRLRDAGFVLRVMHDAEVGAQTLAYAQRIAALAPAAARLNKRTLSAAAIEPLLAGAYDYADSTEHREGVAAFLAKRNPDFSS